MQKRLFTIESNDLEARDTYRIVLRSDSLVTAASGQFVDLALPGYYLRRPISISDCRPDAVVLYYKVVQLVDDGSMAKHRHTCAHKTRVCIYIPCTLLAC